MKSIQLIPVLCCSFITFAQPNCAIFPKESGERKACELSLEAVQYSQGSKESQLLFDEAIAMGPKFAWAYYEKSVPYFKRGFLHQGLQILNQAVQLEPNEYIWYRAYWYWQYKNYQLCINDLEAFYEAPKSYQQFTPGGDKDMRIILGLAYAKEKDYDKGIQVILECMSSYNTPSDIGLSDYHSLGVLYYLNQDYDQTIEILNKQLTINGDIPATYYFLGLALKSKNHFDEAKKQLNNALSKINDPNHFRNVNSGYPIYKSDILKEISELPETGTSTDK